MTHLVFEERTGCELGAAFASTPAGDGIGERLDAFLRTFRSNALTDHTSIMDMAQTPTLV